MNRKRLKRLIIYLLVIVAVILSGFFFRGTIDYTIVEHYKIDGPERRSRVALAVLLPSKGAYQDIKDITVAWDGERSIVEEPGYNAVLLRGETSETGYKTASISYRVILERGKLDWQSIIAGADISPQPDIESENPEILAKAADIVKGDPTEDPKRIFDFVSENILLSETSGDERSHSALMTLKRGSGMPQDLANLMTAISRASGIPARSITGLSFSELKWRPPFMPSVTTKGGYPAEVHAWVEIFLGDKWTIADPSRGESMDYGRSDGAYLSFGTTGEADRIFNEYRRWALENGSIFDEMEGPMRFIVAVGSTADLSEFKLLTDTGVTVHNPHWFFIFITIIILSVIEYIALQRDKAGGEGDYQIR